MRRVVLGLVAVQLAGCSLLFTREPRFARDRPEERVECTESRLAPAIDTGVAAALYASAVALVAWGVSAPSGREAGPLRITASIVPATYGTAAAASAAVGYRRTRSCERVRALQRRCLDGDRAACEELQASATK